jgi:beta-lactamase class D
MIFQKLVLIVLLSFGFVGGVWARQGANNKNDCLWIVDQQRTLMKSGECSKRHPPNSTFKIALALMGFEEGILLDETHPDIPFQNGFDDSLEVWRKAHNPTTWVQNSVVWYSQWLTQKMGMKTFQAYVNQLNYGNRDLTGHVGLNNGLTQSWLSSSLKIAPQEQLVFLRKLINNQLPVSVRAQEMTRHILFLETLPNGALLYGKTGAGYPKNKSGKPDKQHQFGWFVGWVEYQGKQWVFVSYLERKSDEKTTLFASKEAKELIKNKITLLLNN